MTLSPGAKLENYEIVGTLGAGGMGEVYRARDPILKREVAIKVLPRFAGQDPDRLRRFEQEAQAAAALNHPNILAVYQFGSFEGSPYLVSELLEGATLRELLERGPLPVRKVIDYGVQIARGLGAAHEKGIVHRDLKPENLFVTRDGRLKILDFGLAKLMQRPSAAEDSGATVAQATDPGMVMGTVGYMSPEQVRGNPVDHRADIFAFGAILYEMLCGKRAFSKPTSAETMAGILNDDPPSISQAAQATPPGLQRVVHRCLEKNPEQRFQSASDLAFALEALSDSGSSMAMHAMAPARFGGRKTLAGAVGLVAVAAVVWLALAGQNKGTLRVVAYRQITHDGHSKILVGTDGSRLYFSGGITQTVGQVLVSGGETAPVPIAVPNPNLLAVSPDGSTYLVQSIPEALRTDYPLWSVRAFGGSTRALGEASSAAFSPDGNTVVYANHGGAIHEIGTDGAGDRQVASAGSNVWDLSWSPDGKTIRFTRGSDDSLWEMTATGAGLHQVATGSTTGQEQGRWAADGQFFFVSRGQIWAMSAKKGWFGAPAQPSVQITTGPIQWQSPLPAKDGKTVYASGFTPHGELVRLDAESHQFVPFLGGISADDVTFSSDGKSVAYVSFPDYVLWKANGDGSNPMQLTDGTLTPRVVTMSPDGTEVLFEAVPPQGKNVRAYIVSTQGGTPQQLLPQEAGPETDAHFSSDGRKIVFSTSPEGGGDPKSVIRILDRNTNGVTTIPGSTGLFSPRLSPDGRYISAMPLYSKGLKLFDFRTQQWSTPWDKGFVGFECWSKDSQWVYYITPRGNPGVYRLRVSGGVPERLVDLQSVPFTGFFGIWMGLDANDNPMLLRNVGTDDIYALTLGRQ
ncbi:MAG TPA: protein kinase [Acidobacteriaceae bacterium]|jgi:Tol biopolymer transport system component|nr:protein kinase [Acidobacteriaceae bacterium]